VGTILNVKPLNLKVVLSSSSCHNIHWPMSAQDQLHELEQTLRKKEQILKSRIIALEEQERALEQSGVIEPFTLEQLVVHLSYRFNN
jgi:hypothetical protein